MVASRVASEAPLLLAVALWGPNPAASGEENMAEAMGGDSLGPLLPLLGAPRAVLGDALVQGPL